MPSVPARRRNRSLGGAVRRTIPGSHALAYALSLVGLAAAIGLGPAAPAQAAPAAVPCTSTVHIAPSVHFPSASWRDCTTGTITQSSPSVADVGGRTLIAIGDEDGYVHLIDAATGSELPGWPRAMASQGGGREVIESSPAFAWFDGPHHPPSIVVGSGSTWVKTNVGEVEAFSLSGRREFVFPVGSAGGGTAVGVISSPAVGDLTGSGAEDIVFGAWDHNVYALTAHGKLVPGFPIENADTVWSSPALFHRPGSVGDDVYIGADASGRAGCVGGWLSDYRYVAGAPRLVWAHCESQAIWSSPAVGVLANPRRPVVVVGTSFNYQPFSPGTDRLYAYYATNGAPVPGWPAVTSGPALGSPAIGRTGSGAASVVETAWDCTGATQPSCLSTGSSSVESFSASGRREWSVTLPGPTALGSPVLVPLSGEATNDVLVGTPNGLYPIDGASGTPLYGTDPANPFATINPACRVFNTPAVADVLGSGAGAGWHVIEACGGPPSFGVPGQIASFPLPVAPLGEPSWPMFHAGPTHTGLAVSTFASGVTTP